MSAPQPPASLFSRSRLAKLVAYSLVLAAAGGAYWSSTISFSYDPPEGPLFVPKSKLDFGEVYEDQAFVWTLPITNRGSHEIRIKEFSSSCNCLDVKPKSLDIPPGQTEEIQVTLDLTSGKRRADETVRLFSAEVIASVEAKTYRNVAWTVQGRVRKILVFPRQVVFEDPIIRGDPFPSKKVTVQALLPLADLRAICDPDKGILEVRMLASEEGEAQFELGIKPNHLLPIGPFNFPLSLHGVDRNGQSLPKRDLSIRGEVVEFVEVVPEKLLLGARTVGERVEESVVLRSRNGKSFLFEAVKTNNTDITCKQSASDPMRFHLEIPIQESGHKNQEVLFQVNEHNSKSPLLIPLKVSFYGVKK